MDNKFIKNHAYGESMDSFTPDKGTYVQRTHKDTLFRFIFRDKRKLLQLYNAINGSDYQDADDLTIITIENIIYLGYKNDISFLLDWLLYLIEHQSSWNPNMPLRGVLYFSRLYSDYIEACGYNLYGTKEIPLPFPQYIVFYNGTEERPEREIISLSDSFQKHGLQTDMLEPALECKTLVLNINYGKNQELLNKCKPLLDYSRFIYYIRENLSEGFSAEVSVDRAVKRCLDENILSDVLRAHRKEVVSMFLEEYDQELHYRTLKEEAADRINDLNKRLIQDKRMEDFLRSLEDREFQKELLKEYDL